MGIIQLQNVSKQYGDKIILRDLNLDIDAGSFVAISGESGAGKSTLLNIIGGLEQPTSGRIIIDGKNVAELNAKERVNFYRHTVGIIFQGSYLQPQLTLLENITLPGIFAGINKKERTAKAKQLAITLGIDEQLKSLPKKVSGGQAGRACIARALLLDPKIILADEPTSNLDETNARVVLDVLNKIRRQFGVTVIVASHDKTVFEFTTEVITIVNGAAQTEQR